MADMGKTEVDAVSAELINSIVQDQLIQSAVLMPLVKNFAAPAGYDAIKVPRAGDFTVDTKSENVALTSQILTYAVDTLLLDQHKAIAVTLEDLADVQAMPDVLADMVGRMSRQLALNIDEYIVTQLEATSAAAPDHRILYANNATDNTLGKADILSSRELLHIQNVKFDECFIGVSPSSEKDLLAIDDFVHADKYGSSNGLVNGELGKLYGARVVMSNVFNTAKTIVWHPSHVGFARQINPKFESQRQSLKIATDYVLSNLYGSIVMDSGKRGVMLGTAA